MNPLTSGLTATLCLSPEGGRWCFWQSSPHLQKPSRIVQVETSQDRTYGKVTAQVYHSLWSGKPWVPFQTRQSIYRIKGGFPRRPTPCFHHLPCGYLPGPGVGLWRRENRIPLWPWVKHEDRDTCCGAFAEHPELSPTLRGAAAADFCRSSRLPLVDVYIIGSVLRHVLVNLHPCCVALFKIALACGLIFNPFNKLLGLRIKDQVVRRAYHTFL